MNPHEGHELIVLKGTNGKHRVGYLACLECDVLVTLLEPCLAATRKGDPCKNFARSDHGETYCGAHN